MHKSTLVKFFTSNGQIHVPSGSKNYLYILDSQVLVYMNAAGYSHQPPLPFLKYQLERKNGLEFIQPWFALNEITKQHLSPDFNTYHTAFTELVGPAHILAQNPEIYRDVSEQARVYCVDTVLAYRHMVKELYVLNDEIEATRKISLRKELLEKFIIHNSIEVDATLGIGMPLAFRIASRCPVAKGLLKIDEARKIGYDTAAANVAWDFTFLKTLHCSSSIVKYDKKLKPVLVTADKQLQLLASACKSSLTAPDLTAKSKSIIINVSPTRDSIHYTPLFKAYGYLA